LTISGRDCTSREGAKFNPDFWHQRRTDFMEIFLKRSWILLINVALLAGIFILLSGCSQKAEQPNAASEGKAAEAPAPPKDMWVSETTGKEYRVVADNDAFRAEWVNISPESAAHGAYIRTECKRQGTKWVGTSASLLPCSVGTDPKSKIENWCHLETKIEIESITADRISGRGEAIKNGGFDCAKCKILDSEMKDFFWSPKR
jgi:hypothetical protein